MNEQELLKMIEPIKASINQLIAKVDAIDFNQSNYDNKLMDLESRLMILQPPEDGADLNIVPWDYELWKQDPEGWQPVTRDGTYVYELRTCESLNKPYELAGVVSGEIETFRRNGCYFASQADTQLDITHMRRVV